MTISATTTAPEPGLREQKRVATREALISATRGLAAEHGFSHVTVEQICEQVGVSRRTFFNYFPTKEDAILGRQEEDIPTDLAEAFVARVGTPGSSGGALSPTLLDDLVDLVTELARQLPVDRTPFEEMRRAVDKDPRLLIIMREAGARSVSVLSALVARREGVPADDPRVLMATTLVTTLGHQSVMTFFGPDNTRSYAEILAGNVAAARAVFAPT